MKKVLIITQSFPPLNNIAAQRFGYMVQYMEEYGYEPWILTNETKGCLDVLVPDDRIIRISTHPENLVQSSISQETNKKTVRNSLRRKLFLVKNMLGIHSRLLDRYLFSWRSGFLQKESEIKHVLESMDVVLASFGPGTALVLGNYISKKYQKPFIVDFRDLGALKNDFKNPIVRIFDKVIERILIRRAIAITTVSNYLLNKLTKTYNKNGVVIYNGYLSGLENKQLNHDVYQKEYFYYAGQLYLHQLDSFELLVEYLTKIKRIVLFMRFVDHGNLRNRVDDIINKVGAQKFVVIEQPVTAEIVAKEANNSLANIVFENLSKSNEWSIGTITGKLIPLLVNKPPVLAIARDDSEIGDILNITNKGKLCSSTDELESFIRDMNSYSGDAHEINTFSKKEQSKKLCMFLNEILTKD